jgi:hypothetical protein
MQGVEHCSIMLSPHLIMVSVGQVPTRTATPPCVSGHPSTNTASTHLHRLAIIVSIAPPSPFCTLGLFFRKRRSNWTPRTSRHSLFHRLHTACTAVSSHRVSTSPSTSVSSSSGNVSKVTDSRPSTAVPLACIDATSSISHTHHRRPRRLRIVRHESVAEPRERLRGWWCEAQSCQHGERYHVAAARRARRFVARVTWQRV